MYRKPGGPLNRKFGVSLEFGLKFRSRIDAKKAKTLIVLHVFICNRIYIYMCVYVYIYIYIYIYINVYIYIYVCVYMCV